MRKWLFLLIPIIFLCGCTFFKSSSTTVPKVPSGPSHTIEEYLSMKNPESFSYNYTETFSMETFYPQKLVKKSYYYYYKKGNLEALHDSDFIFFTLANGSTYGCQKDIEGKKIIYCEIGFNEGIWETTIPRDTYKVFLLSSLENYTSVNYTSTGKIIGRKVDCFTLTYKQGSQYICFDVQTGIIMKFRSTSKLGKESTLSSIVTGLSFSPPPDEVFELPQVEK